MVSLDGHRHPMSENAIPPDLSVIIVSYQTRELTVACLRSLLNQTLDTHFEVLLWDNASTDGSPEAIARLFPEVDLVASEENVGFGLANNRLASRARGNQLLLLNPDTVVLNGAVDALMEFSLSNPTARLWGGRTLFPDGSLNPTSCWAAPTLWSCLALACGLNRLFPAVRFLNPEGMGGWRRDTIRRVDIVSGAFLMIDTELWNRLGGFHPAFWMYGEDADLCMRARQFGARPIITPDATIVHHGGASEPGQAGKMTKLFCAKAQLYRLHWGPLRAWTGLHLLDLYAGTRVMGLAFLRAFFPGRISGPSETWKMIWLRRTEWHEAYERVGTPPHPDSVRR
jgi:N-acetylglucosaminyl-diphospho-decaprenol L-rhamnosyltransferase